MRVGFFGARSDRTGLGNQWEAMAWLIRPAKILLVDSHAFNGNDQFPERYAGYDVTVTNGFPSNLETQKFVTDLDLLVAIETPYNYEAFRVARQRGIRSYLIQNYEFLDYLHNPRLPEPDIFVSPSYWFLDELAEKLGNRLIYLPPPTAQGMFKPARDANFGRTGRRRFLHVVGKAAVHDRNGTESVLEALKYTTSDFELVITSQKPLDIQCDDRRVTFDFSAPEDAWQLYKGFDALIMPRRYGGLCLPMNEALMSALPVIMTDISPNNRVIPSEWLVPATKTNEFMARTMIDVYSADPKALAEKLDWLCSTDLEPLKATAFDIGYSNYSADALRPKYREVGL